MLHKLSCRFKALPFILLSVNGIGGILHTIICWKIKLVNGQEVEDVAKKKRTVRIKEGVQFMEEPNYQIQKSGLELEVIKKVEL